MEKMDHIARQDRAIENAASDALERGPFVASLIKTLVHTEYTSSGAVASCRATGFVVGLTGEWGLGKSSVLNLLSLELNQMEHVVVATLNPWLFKGRDELIEAYFNSLREALGRSTSETTRTLLRQLERYKASIGYVGTTVAGLIDVFVGGGTATSIWERWLLKLVNVSIKPKELSANQERKSLERKLSDEKIAVVVLIDELDRVEDEEVRAVAQLVKAVGDIKGISYLVAYDPDRVAQALGRGTSLEERQKTGESYLEKIIQFPIPLRPLFEDDSRKLLIDALRNNGVPMPEVTQHYQHEILNELIRAIRTPREIKRLIGAFSVLEEIVRGEICQFDVLAYSWLVTKKPSIRRSISDRIQTLVSDPSAAELIRQQRWRRGHNDANETLLDVLGTSVENQLELLLLLFPRFSEGRQRLVEAPDGNRIMKRRNLVRLLYLGNPPSQLSRSEIERIWVITNQEELVRKLRALQQNFQLSDLLDRVGDLFSVLPKIGDQTFWIALSKKLIRDHDWLSSEEEDRGFVDDVSSILWRLAHSAEGGVARFRLIMEALIESGDLLIAPWVLRKHLFAYGLTPYSPQDNGDQIYDLSETMTLRDREIPRYRSAVMEGTVLRRLPDTEAIFCIVNSDCWDEGLRECFTAQLDSIDAIGSLAALMFPPGISCDRSTLDLLCDAEIILERTNILLRENGIPENEWLATSIRRFRATLQGRNIHTANVLLDDFGEVDE
ncbi:KAP family NTPase [Pseudomonas protegens]|uniref:KAP family NTPase n=1 Tax=Pseudomonas protegens TaxID=380021 RepID=UPI001E32BD6D|nr:KAP family NTPase [Pseudomonas protegens]MCD9572348.1 KAP family NTPase [Pseudomonas protegens]